MQLDETIEEKKGGQIDKIVYTFCKQENGFSLFRSDCIEPVFYLFNNQRIEWTVRLQSMETTIWIRELRTGHT